jgi:hypothetical protein
MEFGNGDETLVRTAGSVGQYLNSGPPGYEIWLIPIWPLRFRGMENPRTCTVNLGYSATDFCYRSVWRRNEILCNREPVFWRNVGAKREWRCNGSWLSVNNAGISNVDVHWMRWNRRKIVLRIWMSIPYEAPVKLLSPFPACAYENCRILEWSFIKFDTWECWEKFL